MDLLKCPNCSEDMMEMADFNGIYTICCECGLLLLSQCRTFPHSHITQEELDHNHVIPKDGTYNYQKETLMIV